MDLILVTEQVNRLCCLGFTRLKLNLTQHSDFT